jgi:hypothetical protein
MKSLEDYAISLVTGLLSLQTLHAFQKKAIDLGSLKDDQEQRINTILFDLIRLMKIYRDQTESVLELLPDDYNFDTIIAKLKETELTKARSMTRRKKDEKISDTH